MIDYELAKKLKDAGFPQKAGRYFGEDWRGGGTSESLGKAGMTGGCYVPTLSELIEACVTPSFTLTRNGFDAHNVWAASTWDFQEEKEIQEYGSSMEEAVALLYLALHERT